MVRIERLSFMFYLRTDSVYISWSTPREDKGLILNSRDINLAVLERYIERMTEAEAKFADFFKAAYDKGSNAETMSYEQLDSWIDNLEDIILEAKASVQGATLAKRERKAKLNRDEREKTSEHDSEINVSDAMSSVNKRKDRLTKKEKLEKMYDDMVSAGTITRADADSMLGLVKVDESKQTTTFNQGKIDAAKAVDTASLVEKVLNSKPREKEEPIDYDSLFK